MPQKTSLTGSELFIVDNSDDDWKAARYLHDWCQLSKSIDIATGYFEIGALLALDGEWLVLRAAGREHWIAREAVLLVSFQAR